MKKWIKKSREKIGKWEEKKNIKNIKERKMDDEEKRKKNNKCKKQKQKREKKEEILFKQLLQLSSIKLQISGTKIKLGIPRVNWENA